MGTKFTDETCEALWDLSLHGCADEECGDVSEIGLWVGLMTNTGIRGAEHAIVCEDSQGFVSYDVFDSAQEARDEFERMQNELAEDGEVLPAVVLE